VEKRIRLWPQGEGLIEGWLLSASSFSLSFFLHQPKTWACSSEPPARATSGVETEIRVKAPNKRPCRVLGQRLQPCVDQRVERPRFWSIADRELVRSAELHTRQLALSTHRRAFSGRFGGYGYGYGHGGVGVIGIILIIIVVLLLTGRL
jgi:hypothetical protein